MFNNINLKSKYLIACSGGPDSMALLELARRNIKHIEVAHVNYHKRATADRDEKIVRKYCRKYKIKLHVYNFDPNKTVGNFQAYAREARYKYFSKICLKNNLSGVIVAHQKDDLIETYLMQLNSKLGVSYYGLNSSNVLYGCNVYRPLLDFEKNELLDFCELNNIEYGIDESNNTDLYERNRIRHSKIDKMSSNEKDKLIIEIKKKNDDLKRKERLAIHYLNSKVCYPYKEFVKKSYIKYGLRLYFNNMSDKFFDEMLRQISECKKYIYKGDDYWISKEYDKVYIFKKPISYSYKINKISEIKYKKYDNFAIKKKGSSFEGATISTNDFPIIIRSPKDNDFINMRYGKKKLNRFFIDNKICIKDRLLWPIVENNCGNAILVPKIGCDIDHYSKKHNFYVIKL